MTIEELKDQGLILFECLSGSHAYGLATPQSDIDIRGVFAMPKAKFYGLNPVTQVSDDTNDTVYYELGRFMELLGKSNPTVLELLYAPEDCVRILHPLFAPIRAQNLLSKQCKDTFGGYATTQIRKAKGLNKKILNPVEPTRKGVLDFCYVPHSQGAQPVLEFLNAHDIKQEDCGLSSIPHMHQTYGLYHGKPGYHGIVRKANANDVTLSPIPKGEKPLTVMSFNKSGYSAFCRDFKAYWDWVAQRNDARYENTMAHGKRYDAKNMMHTFRLLHMCQEVAEQGKLIVRRPDREWLLNIKSGAFEYEDLLKDATQKIETIDALYEQSSLPDVPDTDMVNQLLVQVREKLYQ